jgi:hypothetical protein
MEQNTIKLNNLDLSNKKCIPTFRYITQSSHPAQQKHSLSLSASVPLWLAGYTLGVELALEEKCNLMSRSLSYNSDIFVLWSLWKGVTGST